MQDRLPRYAMRLLGAVAGAMSALCWSQGLPPPGECPQPRFTGKAPDDDYARKNPLAADEADPAAAERLYLGGRGEFGCAECHGRRGDGKGPLASQFSPPPRNFRCAQTVNDIPDGQLFWIVRNGSPGTSMPGYPKLSDQQIWQLVLYLRRLAR